MCVDGGVEVVDEAFLAHVVDDFTRGVEGAQTLATVVLDEVFEDLAEHLGVDGHFLFQRLGLIDGEVVAVEHVEHAGSGGSFLDGVSVGKQPVGQEDVGLLPVVVT